MASRTPVEVEVCIHPSSTAEPRSVRERVMALIERDGRPFVAGPLSLAADPDLDTHVVSARICELPDKLDSLSFWSGEPTTFVYQCNSDGPSAETAAGGDDADNADGVLSNYTQWELPSAEFEGLWESLVYDTSIKGSLLNYAASALLFSDAGVSSNLVAWNHVILLHGPPGTGKTSLCKALAHKLAVRQLGGGRYASAQLIEINAHSLFSRWFSESGKLVARLFAHITDLVEEADSLIFLLIDEVESLTSARRSAVSGSEPSDAVRVVNAVLTAIDALRTRPNVLLLTTSNVSEAIDVAFVDRADLKCFIGPPSHRARYDIMASSLAELMRVGVVQPAMQLLRGDEAEAARLAPGPSHLSQLLAEEVPSVAAGSGPSQGGVPASAAVALSLALLEAAGAAEGMSGRSLRKLPLQAHALYIRSRGQPVSPLQMVAALGKAVAFELQARRDFAA